ncbi:MAG TPA: hypothetical protein VJ860_03585, partial [Polyangia bacterium]|nr:hypothetical protein [Polyangia bacterium]
GGSSSGGAGVGGTSEGGAGVGGSSSGGAGVGGTTSQTGGNTSAGGTTSAGGSIAGSTAASYAACTTDAGVVSGNACAPSPPIIAIDVNCTLGLWSGDGISSGYFYQPWCNSTTTPCTLTMTCTTNSMHIAGSYLGNSVAVPVNGNAGLGANLQVNSSDAGPGCQMINASGLTGLTLDVNVTTIPTGNHLYVGMSLANGNSADGTAVLTTGPQTVKIPWGSFKNKLLCGSIPGPGIASFYIAFDWFNDGVAHAVDITISNFGFY